MIDCPNQQGQDAKNLPAIIAFIANRLPKTSQLIVTFEGTVSDKFDRNIELFGERAVLLDTEYDALNKELLPLR